MIKSDSFYMHIFLLALETKGKLLIFFNPVFVKKMGFNLKTSVFETFQKWRSNKEWYRYKDSGIESEMYKDKQKERREVSGYELATAL